MFINISSDHLYIYQDNHKILVPRGNLEVNLPKVMHQLISEYDFSKNKLEIYVINGPGSFTNLRVGCLVCNMITNIYHHTKDTEISLYNIGKVEFYSRLYKLGKLPRHGMIYIGQQKNYRKCDLETMSYEKVSLVDYLDQEQIDLDPVFAGERYFVDEVGDRNFLHEVKFDISEDGLIYKLDGEIFEISANDIAWEKVNKLIPNYILEPNIGAGKL